MIYDSTRRGTIGHGIFKAEGYGFDDLAESSSETVDVATRTKTKNRGTIALRRAGAVLLTTAVAAAGTLGTIDLIGHRQNNYDRSLAAQNQPLINEAQHNEDLAKMQKIAEEHAAQQAQASQGQGPETP